MEYLLIILIVVELIVNSVTSDYKFYPNLPSGKYRMNFKGITRCHSSTNKIQLNYFLSKKSANSTEIKGNTTIVNDIEFDDSLNMELQMSVRDSIGGWKDNAFVYKSPKACNILKYFMGKSWIPLLNGLGFPNTMCPLSAGTYIATGMDTEILNDSNLPKEFFYGTYRARFYFSKQNEIYGCFIMIIEIKRPWEMD